MESGQDLAESGEGGNLAELLFGRARAKLFAVLFAQTDRPYYFRELARMSGLSASSLQRELAGLLRAGVLEQQSHANLVFYRANPAHPCFAELKGLVDKTAGIAPQLRTALAPLSDRIDRAFIYGSIAAGTPTAASDVDLMVVGDVSFGEVVEAVRPLESPLGRAINPTVYSASQFRRELADHQSFPHAVSRKPRIDLLGASDELDKSRQPRPARSPAPRSPAQGRGQPAARGRRRQPRR
jgi:predicted nucleotidyltransferase